MVRFASLVGCLSLVASCVLPAAAIGTEYVVVEQLPGVPEGWVKGEPTIRSKLMRFKLALNQEKPADFEQRVVDLSTPGHQEYGRHMSREVVSDFVRPFDQGTEKVVAWLEGEHVPAESIDVHGNWVEFAVDVAHAESILRTRFYRFYQETVKDGEPRASVVRTLTYSVPRDIYPYVYMIQPTTRFGALASQVTVQPIIISAEDVDGDCAANVTPDCLRELYQIDDTDIQPDKRNILGISGYLDQYARYGDFEEFLHRFAPDRADANFTAVSINGGRNLQNDTRSSGEASLDIQYAFSLAYKALGVYYSTAGRGPFVPQVGQDETTDAENEPYLDQLHYLLGLPDDELPAVLSTSYGENEQSVPEKYAYTVCNLFAQLGARGVSPTFPANCPFVTAVGGTHGIEPEKGISFSGGGFSQYFSRPFYQEASVSAYLDKIGNTFEGLFNAGGRAIPDVAAQAINYIILDHGSYAKTGGTSLPVTVTMASGGDIRSLVSELQNALNRHQFEAVSDLLSRAKRALLLQNALIPTPSTSPELVSAAREILEVGALASIRQTDAPTFTRYYQQLQPFYDLERDSIGAGKVDFKTSQRSKVTGLYLLLLLSMGDSTSFHTVLEGLVEEASLKGKSVEDDPFIKYPVELERNLMEGSYDKVWRETNSERVPSEEFALFSSVLVGTIRSEIADCSEKAYPSLPISNAKNLLFLESEGAVIEFAQQRGWVLRDGRIYFPVEPEAAARSEKDILVASGTIIENAVGYARELETIV
ncbi:peptidase S8/S53 domain-containing protein [Aspergillus candidus]|uniref:tripeptidyl-peptidase II n=1 Tax=Aspergillus candidus TaxID=41067 RepID=A0A2I2FCS0_ASPCN|nr:peptidase S8/S53 domain-containing protein [Aspergillus candidus]PLB38421.1 peptidase S8/S53 domain-containing protein [Aspergillus candidus]